MITTEVNAKARLGQGGRAKIIHLAVKKRLKNPVRVGETKQLTYFDIFLKLWRAVYPSNKAPIGAKLCENAFQTIPVNSIFGEKKNCRRNFSVSDVIFCVLWPVLEDLEAYGPQNQLPRTFLL